MYEDCQYYHAYTAEEREELEKPTLQEQVDANAAAILELAQMLAGGERDSTVLYLLHQARADYAGQSAGEMLYMSLRDSAAPALDDTDWFEEVS